MPDPDDEFAPDQTLVSWLPPRRPVWSWDPRLEEALTGVPILDPTPRKDPGT